MTRCLYKKNFSGSIAERKQLKSRKNKKNEKVEKTQNEKSPDGKKKKYATA